MANHYIVTTRCKRCKRCKRCNKVLKEEIARGHYENKTIYSNVIYCPHCEK